MDPEEVVYVYSAMLFCIKNEFLPFVTTEVNLEATMLNEIQQTEGQVGHDITLM